MSKSKNISAKEAIDDILRFVENDDSSDDEEEDDLHDLYGNAEDIDLQIDIADIEGIYYIFSLYTIFIYNN